MYDKLEKWNENVCEDIGTVGDNQMKSQVVSVRCKVGSEMKKTQHQLRFLSFAKHSRSSNPDKKRGLE